MTRIYNTPINRGVEQTSDAWLTEMHVMYSEDPDETSAVDVCAHPLPSAEEAPSRAVPARGPRARSRLARLVDRFNPF